MARAKASAGPFMGSFAVVVGSGARTVNVAALRAEIGTWLATQPTPRGLTGCRTVQGPGGVIICQGDCRRPGEICDVKVTRRPGGGFTFSCACQRPITQQPFSRSRARRPAARRTSKKK